MPEFITQISLFAILLTLGAYRIGLWCRKKWDHALCNPLLIAVILVIAVLLLTGISTAQYQAGMAGLSWLLTPATICLALPLYRQLKLLKGHLAAIGVGIAGGVFTSLLVVGLLCLAFRLDRQMIISLLPKSITTAMGMVLAEQNGGIGALAAGAIAVTGILGSLIGPTLCKLFRITHPIAQGVAFGTASHVIGTTKAAELGQLQGAVSSLSLAAAGILTAILFPIVCMLF